jgi:hypothetical protein
MRLLNLGAAAVVLSAASALASTTSYVVPTTTLAAQTTNNTSAANSFVNQTNGNQGASNVSKVDVHSLLYSGESTKVYAHLLLWFGGSNHMNVGYNSADANQVHNQITDMISRGIQGVIVDWYGPNNSIDQATQLVMKEAEKHSGFTFAIMIDQGAIQWDSCSGCNPQQALTSDMQYIEQNYFPSSAYMKIEGRPVVTNFNVDLSYSVDWNAVNATLSNQPVYIFQNNDGFTHVLTGGSYSWVMPTTTDYGISYLTSFYDTGMPFSSEETVGAAYKGFNDTLASWGSNRIMQQNCGQTWLRTFFEINGLYNSGTQLPALQLVTWNDYEEATEIESGISNCVSLSASVSGNSLKWTMQGDGNTIDHYVAFISTDGQNLMPLDNLNAGTDSLNLCSFPIPNGSYVLYLQAVGMPSMSNVMSASMKYTSTCAPAVTSGSPTVSLGANPTAITVTSGQSSSITILATPQSGAFNNAIALACANLPSNLTCSFSPASVTPGANAAKSVLTIKAAAASSASHADRHRTLFVASLFSFGAFGFVFVGTIQRKRLAHLVCVCIVISVVIGATSCGSKSGLPSGNTITTGGSGSGGSGSNTAANYPVTINGNSSSAQFSTSITVTVQ